MHIEIRCHGVALTNELRRCVDQRLGRSLDRFQPHIQSVFVSLSDVNGPKGGSDKMCRVTVVLAGRDRVAISQYGEDAFRMIDVVAGRLKSRVASNLQKGRRFDPTQSIRTETRT
jgi:ribosome-associated translation inhibitor RaiA